jgi:hypothetical protein
MKCHKMDKIQNRWPDERELVMYKLTDIWQVLKNSASYSNRCPSYRERQLRDLVTFPCLTVTGSYILLGCNLENEYYVMCTYHVVNC